MEPKPEMTLDEQLEFIAGLKEKHNIGPRVRFVPFVPAEELPNAESIFDEPADGG